MYQKVRRNHNDVTTPPNKLVKTTANYDCCPSVELGLGYDLIAFLSYHCWKRGIKH